MKACGNTSATLHEVPTQQTFPQILSPKGKMGTIEGITDRTEYKEGLCG